MMPNSLQESLAGGRTQRGPLPPLKVLPIGHGVGRELLVRYHYLHSYPGGTKLAFGVFSAARLLGAITFGAGPVNAHRLVEGAGPADCLVLSRLWLSDELPRNSESRVIGLSLRALGAHTAVKFLVSYADPAVGHVGTIYQASNWLYTGLSEAMPLYNVGDGKARHSRSLSHAYGTHSASHFRRHGVAVRLVPQSQKHRYVYFLYPTWRPRLRVPVLPYPKREASNAVG